MTTYTTVQGDMFDGIAHRVMGSEKYKPALMKANPKHIGYYIFPDGVKLTIPDIDTEADNSMLPPWKVAAG